MEYKYMGGVYFIRKGDTCKEVNSLCEYILKTFEKYSFHVFPGMPVDETIISLAMSVCHLKPIQHKPEYMDFYPCNTMTDIDISKAKCRYKNQWMDSVSEKCVCVHFGTVNTNKWLYKAEVYKLKRMIAGKQLNGFQNITIKLFYKLLEKMKSCFRQLEAKTCKNIFEKIHIFKKRRISNSISIDKY